MATIRTSATARAVILDPAGKMLILKRSQSDPRFPGTWDLPGGRQEDGETIEAAAIRETLEETGLRMRDPRLLFATSDIRDGVSKSWLFYVDTVPADAPIVLSYEHDAYQWIAPEELSQYTPYEILLRLHAYMTDNRLQKER